MAANWEFHSLSIDFDVFKALTAKLESPSDSYNDVLRRMLHLPAQVKERNGPTRQNSDAWVADGVTFPSGTEFRARYKGVLHGGKVENGALVVNGQRYSSPSPAAISITGSSVNGWLFWECRRPGDSKWMSIDGLRSK